MARISSVSLNGIVRLHRVLSDAGFTDDLARLVIANPDMGVSMMNGLRAHPRLSLVHTMYTRQHDLKDMFFQQCRVRDIDVNKFTWHGNPNPPNYSRDPELAVVLYGTLDTLQHTAEFACDWLTSGRQFVTRSSEFGTDRSKLVQIEGQPFIPWKLQWLRIKLDANLGRKPGDVRDRRFSPGCALIFAGAQHPERIRAIAEQKRCGFWMPGLMSSFSNGVWRCVPRLAIVGGLPRAELNSGWFGDSCASCAVPAISLADAADIVPVAV